ncbi:hypothetical protein BDV97DRAFT_298345 [Delphinella strobiligena]|nr:hypothetical protein BDV97DRAFT_298345 [Delphinella strobiligena]
MATESQTPAITNDTSSPPKPLELSIPLPNAPSSRIHMHLTLLPKSLLLFLTSTSTESAAAPALLGSFVYAMPDRYNPTQPLSTPLYTFPSSLDFATRLAKVLARRTGRAAYVGSSVSFAGAGNGGTVEEEMEGFRRVVEVVVAAVESEENGGLE